VAKVRTSVKDLKRLFAELPDLKEDAPAFADDIAATCNAFHHRAAAAPAPFPAVGAFLRAVTEGQPAPALPEGLPDVVREILEKLAEAVGE
jgi:histone deacetylase complex regulatory component SIN3